MSTRRVHPLLVAALVAGALFHGALLVTGSYQRTFDAYVHIFFADHYARAWFDNWEPRWYTGFTVTSYPPGSHQLVALLSLAIGLPAAFVTVQLGGVLLLTLGIYRYAGLWVEPRAAGAAALIGVLGSSLAETVHVFGQLPTTLSLALLLNGVPALHGWITSGGRARLVESTALFAATTAVHHVTTLFGIVFFAGPAMVSALTTAFRTRLPDEGPAGGPWLTRSTLLPVVARRVRRLVPGLLRAIVFCGVAAACLIIVVLPYWLWSGSDPITQIPIPHGSRDSFVVNIDAGLLFFVIPWGVLLFTVPYVAVRIIGGRAWPLALSTLLLALLGTGGTTPIPRALLGGAYEILTLDRFTFWATIAMLPFAGHAAVSLTVGTAASAIRQHFGGALLNGLRLALVVGAVAGTLLAVSIPLIRPTQPAAVDPGPVAEFLAKDQHWRWRYLTLGLGDQMAWLSARTTAATVDGNYHSARRLPQLTSTSVERLDGAKYQGVPGLGSLQAFLTVPERYYLKYVFSNDEFYDPLLAFSGWHRLQRLENGLSVWERPDVPPLPEVLPARRIPLWQRVMWGTLPPAALILALAVSLRSAVTRGRKPAAAAGRRVAWRGPLLRLDTWLRDVSLRIPDGQQTVERWQFWREWFERTPRPPVPGPRARAARAIAALAIASIALVGVPTGMTRTPGPAEAVDRYYAALDAHRFDLAYEMLDPARRPSYEAYRLALSVRGGLLGSAYARLDRLAAAITPIDATHAIANVRAGWTTPLQEYQAADRLELVQVQGQWMIAPPKRVESVPAQEIYSRRQVTWRVEGRRATTDGTTAYADVLDRPALTLSGVRAVTRGGRVSIVGEVVNVSLLPADVTVTARIRDRAGALVALDQVGTAMQHTLLPGERTPFRLDIGGAPGGDTDGIAAPDVAAGTSSIELDARAVATDQGVGRDVSIDSIRVVAAGAGCRLDIRLGNQGARMVDVAQVLVALYDADGRTHWVTETYLPEAVRPQRSQQVVVQLPGAEGMRALTVPIATSVNGIEAPDLGGGLSPDAISLPAGCGSSYARVAVQGFEAQR